LLVGSKLIYWFQPENRKWFWWDVDARDANVIVIAAELTIGLSPGDRSHGYFAPQGPFRWTQKSEIYKSQLDSLASR